MTRPDVERLEQAWQARTDLDGQLAALREAVETLQGMVTEQQQLVLEQGRTIAALRERLDGPGR